MFTADDIKAIRSRTGGASTSPAASSQSFTAADIKKARNGLNIDQMQKNPKVQPFTASVQQTYTAPNIVKPVYDGTPTKIVNPIYNGTPVQKVNLPNYNVQELRSGRDFAVVPQAKPNAERDAYVADYKAKYGGSDFAANAAYALDNNKVLQGAQKFVEATNPIAAIYRTDQALANVANKAINGETAKPYEVGQNYINKADEARQEFRDMTGNGLASDIALAAGDMLAGAATAGSLGVGLTPYLAATSGIQTAGEDINKGRELFPSVIHGVGSGGLTYLVGGLGGIGQTKLGQNLVGKITSVPAIKNAIEAASPKVAKYLGNSIAKFLARAGSEGFEEWLEYPAQTLLENIVFDDAAPLDVKQWWNNTLVGFGVGGLFETSNIALNRLANAPVTRVQDSVQIENPANSQTIENVQGNVLAPLEESIKKQQTEKQARADRINEDLRSRMAENRAQMQRLTEQKSALREAQQLKRESYSTLDNAEIMQRLAQVRSVAGTEQADALRRLAGDIVYSAQVKDNSLAEQYNEARQLVKNTRFRLAAQDRADLGADYKTFAQNNRGKFKLSDNGTPVDSVYMELNSLAPDMFPEDITHPADQLKQIAYFMEITNPDFVNPYSEDTESAVEYIEDKLRNVIGINDKTADIDGYDIPPIGLSAEEYAHIEAEQDAEISRDLNERLDQIIKDCNVELYENIEQLKNADPGVRDAVNSFIGEGITAGADLSEVAGLLQNGFFYNTDISRVLDITSRAGKRGELKLTAQTAKQVRDALYDAIEKPWIDAKSNYTDAVTGQINRVADIFGRLGIKPGSKESAAVQWIGEGQRQNGKELVEYTEADLRREFPDKWKDILEGASAARQIYDEYIDKVNSVRLQMYPEIEARATNEINRLNAKAQAYYSNAVAQEKYIAQKQADLERVKSRTVMGGTLTQAQIARQRQALTLENTILAAEQKRSRQLERAQNYEARASEVQRQIDSGEILRQKRLLPRKDYFHHFTEIAEGFGGLMNIINTPSDISSVLAGVSEYTKPKGKFWGALEQRKGGAYTEDAVSGLAKYIPAAEYAVNIDPFIAHMRGTVKNLAVATAETKNANSLITFLTDWTNELAGKTNKFDRGLMDSMPDRRFMQTLNWVNNRVKANAVVGNLSSAVVQIGNIPNAMTYVPNINRWREALVKLASGQGSLNESKFLKERYLGNTLDKLDKKSKLRRGAENLLEFGDRQAAKLIWQAAYEQYNKDGARRGKRSYTDAADYADDITRRAIAGRGIGEMPLTQKSKLIGMVSPFMVEVNNTFHVIKDAVGEKDAVAVITYAITANLLNALMEAVRGNRPLFDPIDAGWDALKILLDNEDAKHIFDLLMGGDDDSEEEEKKNGFQKTIGAAQRLGGELIANMPYAQAAATLMGAENSEKLFGESDPTRYGTGNIGVSTIVEPFAQLVKGENVDVIGAAANIVPAYGGRQLERFVKGAQTLGYLPRVDINSGGVTTGRNEFGASRAANGRIRFPITEPADQFKTMLFGEWSTSRGKDYIDKGLQPLSDKQSEAMEKVFAAGISPDTYYDAYLAAKQAKKLKDEKGETIKYSEDRDKIRLIKKAVPGLTNGEYSLLFEALGISKNAY